MTDTKPVVGAPRSGAPQALEALVETWRKEYHDRYAKAEQRFKVGEDLQASKLEARGDTFRICADALATVIRKFGVGAAPPAPQPEEFAWLGDVCSCGCPISEHENYGEDGESCEHDDHECVRTSKAVYAMLHALREENAALRDNNAAVKASWDEARQQNARLVAAAPAPQAQEEK